jgi:hypothetical protein
VNNGLLVQVPPLKYRGDHEFNYARIYVFKPFGRNLLLNPSGVDDLAHWSIRNERVPMQVN